MDDFFYKDGLQKI